MKITFKEVAALYLGCEVLLNTSKLENAKDTFTGINKEGDMWGNEYEWTEKDCQPILKPLSSLKKSELRFQGFQTHIDYLTHEKQDPMQAPFEMVMYLIGKQYDVFGLIESHEAVDSTVSSTQIK